MYGIPLRGAGYRSWVQIQGRRRRRNEQVPDPVPRRVNNGGIMIATRTYERCCEVCNTGWNVGTAGCDIFYQAAYYPTIVDHTVCLKVEKFRNACNDCHRLFSPLAMKGAANPAPALYRSRR